jgi:CheY-like chemotaxis protein
MTARPLRILIAEDNVFIALDLASQFEALGCEVVGTAVTSGDAIKAARANPPDLAIVDLQLANGTRGQDAALVLRTEFGVPCVILSGSVHSLTAEERAAIRPIALLSKPVLPHELRRLAEGRWRDEPCDTARP